MSSERFRPVTVEPAAIPYFLCVGTLEPRKNIGLLLEAWREVRKIHAVDLVLVGRTRADFATPGPEAGLPLVGAGEDEKAPG